MEQKVNKRQETIQFIESLVDKGVIHKDTEGNIMRLRFYDLKSYFIVKDFKKS